MINKTSNKTVIIIGAGVASLAVAVRLAAKGFAITTYEKNSFYGGKIHQFNLSEFYFDAGPSLFTQPHLLEEIFTDAGENVSDYLSYTKIDIACKYFFADGVIVDAYTNTNAFAKELHEKLNENEKVVINYLSDAAKAYNNIGSLFLNNKLSLAIGFNKIITAFKHVKAAYLFKRLNNYNNKVFNNKNTVQLFNRFATYNGSNPYSAPAMLSMIADVEQNQGIFYPECGMISISKALYELAVKKGVKFNFNAHVKNIIVSDNEAKGIVVNEENIYSDIVISNADVYLTYKHLLKNNKKAARLLKQQRSSSAIIFYWGMNRSFPELDLHNIFFSADYKHEFDCIFTQKILSNDLTVYINITAKREAGVHAPIGKENWFVMINAPANDGQDWDALVKSCRANVIKKLSAALNENIESCIEQERVVTPVTMEEETASFMGAIYGQSSNNKMAAFKRQSNKSSIKNLYFTGGTVHPGGGIPLCLASAKIVSGLIK